MFSDFVREILFLSRIKSDHTKRNKHTINIYVCHISSCIYTFVEEIARAHFNRSLRWSEREKGAEKTSVCLLVKDKRINLLFFASKAEKLRAAYPADR